MSNLLIFDFDGVIADSECVANAGLAETVTELGVPTTLEDSYNQYMGRTFSGVVSQVESIIGRKLPANFWNEFQTRTIAEFRQVLKFVDGAEKFIDEFSHIPKCIASNSSPERLDACKDVLGLHAAFETNVFSASNVRHGKPHPEIFLAAANKMGVKPSRTVVIEDSISGVQAGVSAGMTVIGLLAASHIQMRQRDQLKNAGAHHIADSFAEVKTYVTEYLD